MEHAVHDHAGDPIGFGRDRAVGMEVDVLAVDSPVIVVRLAVEPAVAGPAPERPVAPALGVELAVDPLETGLLGIPPGLVGHGGRARRHRVVGACHANRFYSDSRNGMTAAATRAQPPEVWVMRCDVSSWIPA